MNFIIERAGTPAVACSELLGIMVIACLPAFVKKSQARLRSLVLKGRQRRCATWRSHGASRLQTVTATLPVKAILLLLGRPWEGSSRWPNLWVFPKATYNTHAPNTNAPASKMRHAISCAATSVLWSVRTQLTILLWEIVKLLLGVRHSSIGENTTWHQNAAHTNELTESPSGGRETIGQATQLPGMPDSCDTRMMPNDPKLSHADRRVAPQTR